jgi:hypothetical protein
MATAGRLGPVYLGGMEQLHAYGRGMLQPSGFRRDQNRDTCQASAAAIICFASRRAGWCTSWRATRITFRNRVNCRLACSLKAGGFEDLLNYGLLSRKNGQLQLLPLLVCLRKKSLQDRGVSCCKGE